MKTTLALVLFALALSLCNLIGRRGNTNTNANSRSAGEIAEASPASSPAEENSNKGAPPPAITQSAPRAGVPSSSLPGVNHNSAASVPHVPKTISGGVLNGRAISLPKPAYPAIAKAAHASGTVHVQVLVDESGNVMSANAVSGHPLLKPSAVAAARGAKFRPTMLSGQAVKVTGVIVYNFVEQ